MKKVEVLEKLRDYNVEVYDSITVSEAKMIFCEHVFWNVPFEVVKLAEEQGHIVLFTPPCYSDLQPIELVWAFIKGRIGRMYSLSTTLSDVKNRLDAEFQSLFSDDGSSLINRIINSVDKTISRFEMEIEVEEQASRQESISLYDTTDTEGDTTDTESDEE